MQYYERKPSLEEMSEELNISYGRLKQVLIDAFLIELVDASFPDSITESEEELVDGSFPDSITESEEELEDTSFPDSITESEEELVDASFPDLIAVPTQSLRPVEQEVITGEIKEQLLQEFENLNLSPTRIKILKLRSLMKDTYSLSECEKMLHISRPRVYQLEHNALCRLKNDIRMSFKGYINELEEYKDAKSPKYRMVK